MATEKNITMKQFNGTDYDTLYPKTKVEQVEGAYTQQQILSDSTKALYSLGSDAVPDDVFEKITNAKFGWELIREYKEAGSYTFTVPDGVTEIGVYMVGGGGSGGAALSTNSNYSCVAAGGAAGYGKNLVLSVTPGQQIDLVVGAGAPGKYISGTRDQVDGDAGGTTSFNGVTVAGGSGGKADASSGAKVFEGAMGGQPSDGQAGFLGGGTRVLYGCVPAYKTENSYNMTQLNVPPYPARVAQNAFNQIMVTLCAGAGASSNKTQVIERMPDGTGGGTRGAIHATGNGNGGAAVANYMNGSTAQSGNGSPGMVLIYKRGGVA